MKQKNVKKATWEREPGALTKFARHFGTKRNIIVTHDSEHETVVVGIKIEVRPLPILPSLDGYSCLTSDMHPIRCDNSYYPFHKH